MQVMDEEIGESTDPDSFRDGNKVADVLAQKGTTATTNQQVFLKNPPTWLLPSLPADKEAHFSIKKGHFFGL